MPIPNDPPNLTAPMPDTTEAPPAPAPGTFTDKQLLQMWTEWKRQCMDQRWVFERNWLRNIWYMLGRHWIFYDSRRGWQDKRLAKWVPRPVTNLAKVCVQSVMAMFAAINYGTNARPVGEDRKNVITASVADDYAPVLHEDHQMDQVMAEFDWWMLVCGNAVLHTCVEYDRKNGVTQNPIEVCAACQQETTSAAIANAGGMCPQCKQGNQFTPAINPDGSPKVEEVVMPKGVTVALSPFEYMFPIMYERFELSPIVVRARWRDKSYYEQHEELSPLVSKLPFTKMPHDRSMQIFKSMPFQSDLGIAPPYFGSGGSNGETEGLVEYDVWVRPCKDFPKGQVIRFAGEQNPIVIHLQREGLPGPLPYTDARGNPIWTFHHARFDRIGGRPLGSSLIDPIIQKIDTLNQLDSMMLMIVMRMSNPIWLEPKGAEVEKFTGEPGLVVKWNPLISGGNAKPERIPGESIPQGLFAYRELVKQEIKELAGTHDMLEGTKPSGVEAYAAMSLLLERSQARFTCAFKERGTAYKGWYRDALEIERAFGEETRIRAVMSPTKSWAFKEFKKADLGGAVEIIIEDGTLSPKTSLGERASIEHLRQLGLLNPQDPDQVMAIFQKFGQERLLPGLDAQVKEAWMVFDAFEKWISDPQAVEQTMQQYQQQAQQAMAIGQPMPTQIPSPLRFKPWYNPMIHRQELVKWCVSDRGRDVFANTPAAEQLVAVYLQEIEMALMIQQGMQPQGPGQAQDGAPKQPGGAGAAMANSNRNAAGAGPSSSGSAGTSQNNVEANANRSMSGSMSA